jgi:hypothetical protein
MRKTITCILLVFVFAGMNVNLCKAGSPEAASSGVPKFKEQEDSVFDYRVYTLRKFLDKYDSPLTPYSSEFIAQADYYGIDYRMIPAITGVESSFGKNIPLNSYNAYGWANGKFNFSSWPDSIQTVTKTIKYKYIDKGATSISKISRIYAPPSTTWGGKVQYFVSKINTLPLSFDI